jgi:hypothetical protein
MSAYSSWINEAPRAPMQGDPGAPDRPIEVPSGGETHDEPRLPRQPAGIRSTLRRMFSPGLDVSAARRSGRPGPPSANQLLAPTVIADTGPAAPDSGGVFPPLALDAISEFAECVTRVAASRPSVDRRGPPAPRERERLNGHQPASRVRTVRRAPKAAAG